MSSKALRTVLFPEPESPVRMTRCRASCRLDGFTWEGGLTLHPALMRAGDSHVFAIFSNGAARDVNAGVVELLGDLLVGERLRAVFFFNHFLYETLQGEQRHCAALRPVHGFAEEGAQFEHTLRSVGILAGHGAAHSGRM